MSSIFRIVGFAGCVREESYNKAALHLAQDLVPTGAELEILSLTDLPSFHFTTDHSEPGSIFQEKIREADAVIIMTPEYKGMLPKALKNALDWSRTALAEKPIAIMGIGRQTGSEHELQRLRQILTDSHAVVLEQPEVYVTAAQEKFDRTGSLIDEATLQQIHLLLQALMTFANEKAAVLVR